MKAYLVFRDVPFLEVQKVAEFCDRWLKQNGWTAIGDVNGADVFVVASLEHDTNSVIIKIKPHKSGEKVKMNWFFYDLGI
jgi:hypothetical protein